MATIPLTYATIPGTNSPSYGGIGWFNWGAGFSIANGVTLPFTASFRDGSTISFDLNNSVGSGASTNVTSLIVPAPFPDAPFGRTGYRGLSANLGLYAHVNFSSQILTFSNIVVKDVLGNTVPDFYIIAADAEATGPFSSEFQVYKTNGSAWQQIALLPPPTPGGTVSPSIVGVGTNTVTLTGVVGTTNAFQTPVLLTHNPTRVSAQIGATGSNGDEVTILGAAINAIHLNKIITNRFFANDQFDLSITGTPSSSTITNGAIYGPQPVSSNIIGPTGNSYTLNETMDPGSSSLLSQYTRTVQYTNLSPGGTAVPISNTLPTSITLALGDIFVATVVNSILPVTITSTKTVDKNIANINDILTYTIVMTSTGSVSANNVIIIDTIPNGTTFIQNSLIIDGVSDPGDPNPPLGVNIGNIPAFGVKTVSFKVTVNSTIPSPNPIINNSSGNFTYAVLPVNGTGLFNSNSTNSQINAAIINSSKIVDKVFANIGDVLTYTIPITNSGNISANNIIFIDTIPNGTTIVSNSFKQDGFDISGNPNPSGVTLPNSIGNGKTSTVTFKVTVLTIPSPNPIPNSATQTYDYIVDSTTTPNSLGGGSINTNTVSTQINNANLGNITKSTDKSYAKCGDIVTYTVTIPNSGSTTALNIVLIDTIPNGTSFISNSVIVNGVTIPGSNPSIGVTIPNISPADVATLTFKVQVNC
ncbi:CshA/CshB family fibrillar adhesin-related protein [Romboutsia sp.]|uniref:CshA/CshB family fibrillar adhesin-related protein n=1 Tax=Romboutsia sp. TaxID=1965302 RepID=UPI003F3FD2B6